MVTMLNKILNKKTLLIEQRLYMCLSFPPPQKGSTGRCPLRAKRFPSLSFRTLNKEVLKSVKVLIC